jgi:hypothetical protein
MNGANTVFAEMNHVRMFADWRRHQPKGAKKLPQVEASSFWGILPPILQGLESVKFQQIAKRKV